MGGWYRVIKTIKGNRYLYEQQTYREGGRVRTRNRYIGRAGEGGKTATPPGHLSLPTSPLFTDPSDFGRTLAAQFDAPAWGRDAQQQVLGGKPPIKTMDGAQFIPKTIEQLATDYKTSDSYITALRTMQQPEDIAQEFYTKYHCRPVKQAVSADKDMISTRFWRTSVVSI